MSLSSQYEIIDTLHANDASTVYRARDIESNQTVIIKMLRPSARTENNIIQFVNEQQILAGLRSNTIAKLLKVVAVPSEYILVFEDIGGSSLYDLLLVRSFELAEGLSIAHEIAKTLLYLHQKHIIHADVNPKNIVYNPETKAMQMVDFGYSVIDNNFRFNSDVNVGTSGNLLYMSPEQTGRTKQRIDLKSDLYSFGMTLYHLFSGRPPFEAKNRYELIHKQIALSPIPLHEVNPKIPLVLSRIVEKLIRKKPDERYGSDEAVVYDLKECIRLLTRSGEIEEFVIATQDRPVIRIGEHLFGRDKELALLQDAANYGVSNGSVKVLVSGQAGVGKTRLAEEFFNYFDTGKTHILRGKFDQYKTALPYLTFKQIFGQLHTFLMSQNHTDKILTLHPTSERILCYLFPELRDIFFQSDRVEFHSHEDIVNQLPFAVGDFFNQIATSESPIVFVMDDLQWADHASVVLIKKAILERNNPHIHFIGLYRDNEIQANTSASELIQTIVSNSQKPLFDIKLLPLQEAELHEMLQNLFADSETQIEELASIVYKKTNGNPFFVKTFLYHLIDSNEVSFVNGQWNYSLETIKTHSASLNIAEIINSKFDTLSPEEKFYLQHLALLGSRFDLHLTYEMMNFLGYSNDLMEQLEAKGFIEQVRKHYQFVHDQIQQNAFALLDDETKRRIHFDIGRYLERAQKRARYEDIITTVNHLNKGYVKGEFPQRLFKLNIKALEEFLLNNSYALALNQMRWIESNLFDERLWSEKRSDAFRYVELSVKILYLNALHDEAYALVNVLSEKAKNIQERLKCFTLLKNICVTQGKNFPALVAFGNRLLQELGVRAPVLAAEVNESTQTLKEKLINHPLFDNPDAIMELPQLKNSKKHRIASLLVDYWEAAYYLADIPLMQWAYLNIVDSSFRYGNSSESTFGYVLFGAQLIGEKKYKKGYAFGEVALKLNGVLRDEIMLPKVHNFVANFINPYVKPLCTNVMLYQKSLQQSKINDDIVFGTWANFLMHFSDYLSGSSLEVLRNKIGEESTFILNSGDEKMISIFNILVHTVHALQEKCDDRNNEEERAIAMWEKDKFYPALAWYGVLKAQNCLIEGTYEEGIRYLDRYVHSTANEVIMFPKIRLHFIRALLLLGKETALNEREDELLRFDLSECEEIMNASPANFKFGKLLLRAEQMKLQKKSWETAKVYDAALEEARKKNDPFFAALGALCASRFWKSIQYEELSRIYLNEAIVSLNQWGAYEVANRLKGLVLPIQSIRLENSSSHSSSLRVEPENFKSLLNSFYAISRAMDQTELINTLMQTILENATASRAILLLLEGDTFSTKARLDFKGGKIEFDTLSLSESPMIPQNIVQYAINTGKKVLVTNPAQSGQFQFDEYIKAYKPASCIAIPTSVDGNVLGVLYLENEEIATPLSPESIQTLELLLTQAAIVFKNTTLYETLKTSEENLNKAQQISHVGSWQYNSATCSIVWSAETYRIYDVEPFSIQIDNDWFFDHLHPQDLHRVLDAVEKALSAQKPYDIVHRILTVTGEEKIVHQRAEVFWEADQQKMSGTIQDITDSAHAEAMISRLNQVVYQNPFSTIITDKYGVIEYVNAQCVKMTGYFEHELLGQKMNIFGSGVHSKAFYAQLWKTIAVDRQMWRGTIVNRMKNNQLCDCSSTIFPLFNTNNEITNFVTVQEDITDKNIKDKLFLMQTRQAQMGEMLSMIAHQWRQPLAIISALMNKQRVDIMLEKSTMSDVAQSYEDIEFQVQHLSRTITDFRDFFKPDKEMTRTKSSTMVTKAAALIGHTLKQKNIALDVTHAHDNEYLTFEHEMIQVLLNLIKNAQDSIEEHGIGHAWIKITTDQADDTAVITVEDNAGGIEASVIDTLFLPYVSTKNEQNGTGLGLYMSKTIIEEHCAGSIAVENTENGAKFTIKIALKGTHGNI